MFPRGHTFYCIVVKFVLFSISPYLSSDAILECGPKTCAFNEKIYWPPLTNDSFTIFDKLGMETMVATFIVKRGSFLLNF